LAIFAAWALGLALCCLSTPPVRAEQAQLQGYGQAQGLGNLAVTTLAQDTDGYIWAGTQNGLYRFDGERFVRVAQDHLVGIVALAADPKGGLWVGTDNGLYHWRPGALHHVPRGDGRSLELIGSTDLALDPSGTPWVISDSMLYEIRRVGGQQPWQADEALDQAGGASDPVLSSIAAARDGTLWLACDDALCRRAGRRLERVAVGDGALAKHQWTALLPARDGSLWLRSASRAAELPPGGHALIDRGLPSAAAGMKGLSHPLVEDHHGRILTGGTQAFARLAVKGGGDNPAQVFDRSHGMPPGGRFLALLVDRDGGVWLSRAGTGLWRWLGYERWEHWSVADGLPHDVAWAVARDRAGVLHVATNAGAAHFDHRSRRFIASPGTAGTRLTTLHTDAGGQVWAATAVGTLLRRHPGPATAFVTAAHGSSTQNGLLTRLDGTLWFAGDEGVGWWPNAGTRPLPLGAPMLVGERQHAADLCETPNGGLWAISPTGMQRIAPSGEVT